MRHVTTMTINDVGHYTDPERQAIIASYPEHEREARAMGVPTLGSGKIFPVSESSISFDVTATKLPDLWPRIAGMDFGITHPTSVVWLAWDRDEDVTYLYDAIRIKGQTPRDIAPLIIQRGQWIPVSWPADGLQTEKGSGMQLAEIYRSEGVNMAFEPAALPETGADGEARTSRYSVEAGLSYMLDAMKSGRFKVAGHLTDWYDEMRLYHRKDGKVVKEHDDTIDASRYAWVARRNAIVPPAPDAASLNPRRAYDWRAG